MLGKGAGALEGSLESALYGSGMLKGMIDSVLVGVIGGVLRVPTHVFYGCKQSGGCGKRGT